MAEKKIGGKVWRIEPMTAVDALKLYADIMRIVTPAAGRLPAIIFALSTGDEEKAMADVAALSAISDILARTSSEQIADITRTIVESAEVSVDGGKSYIPVDIDVEFTGALPDLIPVAKFVLEEQFRDFFIGNGRSGIISLLTEVLQKRKSAA
ncbi:MAG: hypothetical protein LCH99_37190 [Proteobacteria bacterium]|nr:hypothetical protein [Pseudomonadota bacterium]